MIRIETRTSDPCVANRTFLMDVSSTSDGWIFFAESGHYTCFPCRTSFNRNRKLWWNHMKSSHPKEFADIVEEQRSKKRVLDEQLKKISDEVSSARKRIFKKESDRVDLFHLGRRRRRSYHATSSSAISLLDRLRSPSAGMWKSILGVFTVVAVLTH